MDRNIDVAILKIYNKLFENGFVEKKIVDMFNFYQYEKKLEHHYFISDTSITKVMSRILYLLGQNFTNKFILGAGIYAGNAISWLSYDVLENKNGFMLGVDISEEAITLARKNLSIFNQENFEVKVENIFFTIEALAKESIDIFYLDIDSKEKGKSEYKDIVERIYPKIKEKGLILAHDINEKKFEEDMSGFEKFIINSSLYKGINIDIDNCGLLLIRKEESM
ncbi:TPA: class I SAM-dependent methyltransferase [Staphylococcus aureus]|nr:class I SAM-dependent methyltransferase [Staphylococcus aureus]HCW9832509.1 class I SAM-dependent methyltransferase [Staphylococcus aureus]